MATFENGYFVAARSGNEDIIYRITMVDNPTSQRVFQFDQVFEPVHTAPIYIDKTNMKAGTPQLLFTTDKGLFLLKSNDDVLKWNGSTFVAINPTVSSPASGASGPRPITPTAKEPIRRPATGKPTARPSAKPTVRPRGKDRLPSTSPRSPR